ncbi:MAG: histidine phosphatase family protein [Gammaproteobacteria bacterium]
MELILIRHGLPVRDDNSSDPPLSEEGRRQARLLADWLHARPPIDALYTSPMARAMQTSQPYAKRAGKAVPVREGVEELDRSSGRYVPMEELKRTDYAAWRAYVGGGFQSSADIVDFQRRVVETLEDLIAAHPGERVAVFCHGGVINVWASHVLGMPPRMFFTPDYTSVNRFMCARSGQRNVASLNELAHLG